VDWHNGAYAGARHKRHTFASLLIQTSESLAYVKDQLGHSSIKITVDTGNGRYKPLYFGAA
jgi:integrase